MSKSLCDAAWEYPCKTGTQKMVLLTMCWYAGSDGISRISVPSMAAIAGMSVRTVQKMLKELSRLGVIEKISGTEFSVYRIKMAGEKLDDIGKAVCEYCSSSEGHLEFDHVIPVSRGGKDDLANMAFSCRPCNNAKSNKTPSEWLGEVRHAVVSSL